MLSVSPILKNFRSWWLQRAEEAYLSRAELEEKRAKEAQLNASFYQEQADLVRTVRQYQQH